MTLATRVAPGIRSGPDAVTWLVVYLTFLFAIPTRLVIPALGSAGAPSLVVGLASFLGWMMYQIGQAHSASGPFQTRPVRKALVLFLICVAISYALAMSGPIDSDEVSPADVALLSVLSWSGTLLVANDGIPSLSRAGVLAHRMAWAGGLLGALGLAQFLTNDILIDGIVIPGLRVVEFEVFQRGGFVRPSGTATHPIEFGIILAMMLPFALHAAYQRMGRNVVTRWLPVLLLGASIAMTFSRSAYISVGVALVVLLIGWPAKRRLSFGIGLALLCAMLFAAVPRLFGTITSLFRNVGNDPSISSRTDSYDIAFEFIAQAPFFGRGLGTFLPKYRIFDNQYLVLLVSIGVIGTVAAVLLFLSGIKASLAVARSEEDDSTRDLGLTIAASIAAGAVSLATFDAFAFPMTMGTLFLMLGFAGGMYRLTRDEPHLAGVPAFAVGATGSARAGGLPSRQAASLG